MQRHSPSFVRAIVRWVWVPVVSFALVVVVAMACAVWSPMPGGGVVFGAPLYNSESVPEPLRHFDGMYTLGLERLGFGVAAYHVEAFTPTDFVIKTEVRSYNLDFVIAGFPFRCLRWSVNRRIDAPKSSVWTSGIETNWTFGPPQTARRIPLMPEPVGMVLNVLIYSTAIVLVRMAWRRAVVIRRKRKNLCVKCGYPMGDFAVCPECGEPIESS